MYLSINWGAVYPGRPIYRKPLLDIVVIWPATSRSMSRVSPFAGVRYAAPGAELERLVCPPYDVITPAEQAQLQAASPYNAIHLELPTDEPGQPGSRYARAARCLADWRTAGMLRTDSQAAYYLAETEYSY